MTVQWDLPSNKFHAKELSCTSKSFWGKCVTGKVPWVGKLSLLSVPINRNLCDVIGVRQFLSLLSEYLEHGHHLEVEWEVSA